MANMTATNHPMSQDLIAGDFPRRFRRVTIAADQVLAAGAVLGEITANSEYALAASAAGDGSESPSVVLWEPIDTTGAAGEATVLLSGDVRASKLTLGSGTTEATARKALRDYCLFVD